MTSPDDEKAAQERAERERSAAAAAPTTSLGSLLQGTTLPKASHGPQQRRDRPESRAPGAGPPQAKPKEPTGKPARGGPGASPEARAEARAAELAARKRVATLTSGGVHFKLKRAGDHVQAARGSTPAKLWARLESKTYVPELTLDLRAQPTPEVTESVAAFLRLIHRRGVRQLVIAIGDGPTPDEPREQRLETVITALIQGASSPLVRAFTTAHENLGGTSSLAILLI